MVDILIMGFARMANGKAQIAIVSGCAEPETAVGQVRKVLSSAREGAPFRTKEDALRCLGEFRGLAVLLWMAIGEGRAVFIASRPV